MSSNVEESTIYDNCIGTVVELEMPSNLNDFLGIEDEDTEKEWEKHWLGMPEFDQKDNPPHRKLIINFRNEEDFVEFSKLLDQTLSEKTKSIWFPKLEKDANSLKRWIEVEND